MLPYYVPMKRHGEKVGKEAYEKARVAIGLEESPSFSGARYGEEGDTYFVKYDGQRTLLERHLKKGMSREPRHCFRLYFFWDNHEQVVVVGWLPSHLDTRAS